MNTSQLRLPLLGVLGVVAALAFWNNGNGSDAEAKSKNSATEKKTQDKGKSKMSDKVEKTDAEWRKELSPEAYDVLRQHGTERPWTGTLLNNHEKGVFECAGCGNPLFASDTKFDSGTGWPSFYKPVTPGAVVEKTDYTYGMKRTEVLCGRCGGHLGHVFDDGPKPTGLRYCMNSVAMQFDKTANEKK